MSIKCWWNGHQWRYWHTEKDTPKERVFRACKICGKTQGEVWTGFSEYYWCPVGYTKQDAIDALFSGGIK